MGNVVLWDAVKPHLPTKKVCYHIVCVWFNSELCKKCEYSDMSGDGGHPDGPDTDLLVSLHKLLQAGQRTDVLSRRGWELQLRLPRFPPLHRALLLAELGGRVLEGERQVVSVAQAGEGEDGGGRGEAACVGLLRVGGRAAAAGL